MLILSFAGTGQVERAIATATFHPQAAAFTSLLHMCAKNKLWQKALEVFEAMQRHHPGVAPNKMHFSSLISACATAGRWQEATKVRCLTATFDSLELLHGLHACIMSPTNVCEVKR